jgi:long-chain acyl-CoA synthetase
MIYNDHKKYTTALITLNKALIQNEIDRSTLGSSSSLAERLKEEMLLFSSQPEFKDKFPVKWIPSNFQIIDQEFSEENQMINSTLKMVRHKITESYQERLDLMYGSNAQKLSQEKNLAILDSMFRFPVKAQKTQSNQHL